MLGFFFRKNFYEGWDNVLLFFVPNLILDAVIVVLGIGAFFVTKIPESLAVLGVALWAFFALALILCASIMALAWAESAAEIVDYGVLELREFFKAIKGCVKDGIKYGLVLYVVTIITIVGAIYYLKPQFNSRVSLQKSTIEAEGRMESEIADEDNSSVKLKTGEQDSFAGLLAGFMFLWISASIYMGLFWYPALRSLLHDRFGKSMKKCFVILFDNFGKSFVIGLYNIFLFFVSVILLGLAPGLAGIGLSRENAMYLLLKKYDYLAELDKENEPKNSRKRRRIPWGEILEDDIAATGTRTLKGFFMPWKELEEQGAKDVKRPKLEEEDEKWKE